MSKLKTNIKKARFKVGDCFVGRETLRGISLVRVIVNIDKDRIYYQNSNDKDLFDFSKGIFRYILLIDDSKYIGNILSNQ
jgi:hypothetical protein